MKKVTISILVLVAIICASLTLAFTTTLAHTTSQRGILEGDTFFNNGYDVYYIGSEEQGWSIDESYHAGSSTIEYSIDYRATALERSKAIQAVQMWDGIINFTYLSAGRSIISFYNDPDDERAAVWTALTTDHSTGHVSKWSIKVNMAHSNERTAEIIAHELGHAIGLNDLYTPVNKNKLMYGRTDGTATGPTTQDIWGAKVITGQHAVHTWRYSYGGVDADGNWVHNRTCTQCGGIGIKERCTLIVGENGLYCRKCNPGGGLTPVLPPNEEERPIA